MPNQAHSLEPKTSEAKNQTKPYATWWIVMLGSLTALGPLSIDMYLPALPAIAGDFGVDTEVIAGSVTAYFAGLVVGQLLYGPLSDRIGRTKPLYFGLLLYVIASVLCALATSPSMLIAARVLQALGGSAGVVMARAAVRDTLEPVQMSQAFSMLILVMGIAPIIAPALGDAVVGLSTWRVLFWVLAGVGALNLVWVLAAFSDTLEKHKRQTTPLWTAAGQYVQLLKDPLFTLPALGSGFLMGALFVYINASSMLVIEHFGLSPTHFSWVFGVNAAGLIGLSQLNARWVKRHGLLKLFNIGTGIQIAGASALLVCVLLGINHIAVVLGLVFVIISAIGLTAPNGSALALAKQAHRSGLASAMLGAMQFFLGILGGLMLQALPYDILHLLAVAMFALMGIGALITWDYNQREHLHI